MYILLIIVLLIVGVLAYVRLAPHDISRWHRAAPEASMGETTLDGGYIWRAEVGVEGPAKLAKLDQIIRTEPRTELLTGSVQERQLTYVTRSKVMGFPDYATVTLADGVLEIYSRLRFGKSDMGVNAKRVKGWIAQL